MKTEEKEAKHRTGIFNFERRTYRRISVDLPVEYYRIDSPISRAGRALNASEGGLLIYFPEDMKIGQHLKLKLLLVYGRNSHTVETLVQVVWMDIHLEGQGDYRTGVRFVDISPEDMTKLKDFLRNLSNPLRSP